MQTSLEQLQVASHKQDPCIWQSHSIPDSAEETHEQVSSTLGSGEAGSVGGVT